MSYFGHWWKRALLTWGSDWTGRDLRMVPISRLKKVPWIISETEYIFISWSFYVLFNISSINRVFHQWSLITFSNILPPPSSQSSSSAPRTAAATSTPSRRRTSGSLWSTTSAARTNYPWWPSLWVVTGATTTPTCWPRSTWPRRRRSQTSTISSRGACRGWSRRTGGCRRWGDERNGRAVMVCLQKRAKVVLQSM